MSMASAAKPWDLGRYDGTGVGWEQMREGREVRKQECEQTPAVPSTEARGLSLGPGIRGWS